MYAPFGRMGPGRISVKLTLEVYTSRLNLGRNGGRAISRQTRLVRPDHAVSLAGTARISAMKALVLSSLSGPDALSIQEFPEPAVKTGQTLVRVSAGGLNFADVMTTKGGYPGTPAPPMIVGREFAGVEQSTGRRVMGYAQWAAFAERTPAYSNMLWPVPEHWTDEEAAA